MNVCQIKQKTKLRYCSALESFADASVDCFDATKTHLSGADSAPSTHSILSDTRFTCSKLVQENAVNVCVGMSSVNTHHTSRLWLQMCLDDNGNFRAHLFTKNKSSATSRDKTSVLQQTGLHAIPYVWITTANLLHTCYIYMYQGLQLLGNEWRFLS